MRVILDTNVLVSGIFFGGPPYRILKAWRDGKIELVVSNEILEEYYRVSESLALEFPEVDIGPFLALLTFEAELVHTQSLPQPDCDDPSDDKFLACALYSAVSIIISGDRHLLRIREFHGIKIHLVYF